MKLVTFSVDGDTPRPGVLFEETNLITDLASTDYKDALSVVAAGLTTVPSPGMNASYKLSDARLHAPISNPPRIFAIGLNYRDHAAESKMQLPTVPVVFFKMSTAIIGPGESIVLPKNTAEPDYEAEFAFDMGKGGMHISSWSWRGHG